VIALIVFPGMDDDLTLQEYWVSLNSRKMLVRVPFGRYSVEKLANFGTNIIINENIRKKFISRN
jgi:hypothetical protein